MALYEPREDSFLLAKHVQKLAFGNVLDVGSGSGIQATAALRNPRVKDVLAIDIDQESLLHLRSLKLKTKYSDLFSSLKPTEKFDTIIFNPPYLPTAEKEDPETARQVSGGQKGNELLERFLKDARRFLAKKGIIVLIVSSLTPEVESLIASSHYAMEVLEEERFFFEQLKVLKLWPVEA